MRQMVYYELKKIFVKKSSQIAMLMLLILLGTVCWIAIHNVEYINERGEPDTGAAAARKLKEAEKEWAGVLDEEMIRNVIKENFRICATPEALSDDVVQSNIAYGWKQGFSDIRRLLVYAFNDFNVYDYYVPDHLTPEDAKYFYSNRELHLREWLEGPAANQYTEEEKAFLIQRYETLQTPLQYDYMEGWKQLTASTTMLVMIMVLILGFLTASIFSGEFQLKADAVFFASRYGREKAVTAKIKAGFLLVTGIYWLMMLLHAAVVLGVLGADGAGCMIQTNGSKWMSFYHITFLQEYLLIAVGGYVGALSILFLTMIVSAWSRSSVLAVIVPFILIFIPEFVRNSKNVLIDRIMGFFPDMLLQINSTIKTINLFQIGGKVFGSIEVLFVINIILVLVLLPAIFMVYRRAEVK